MHLTDLINEQQILLSFEAKDKLEVIHKLATLLDSQDLLHSFEDYKRAVLEREETFSTSVGMNVAIPHGRSSAVKRAAVAFGRLNPPIEWEKGSGEEVKLVFLLAVPESGADNQHLAILAALSRALVHDEKRQEFLTARNIEELMKAFEGITVK